MLSCTPANPARLVHFVTANDFLGLHEVRDNATLKSLLSIDPARIEWCAAFVNVVLNLNAVEGSEAVSEHPLMARSFLLWGESVDTPRLGDIIVFSRGRSGWQGHVGFYMETVIEDGVTYYKILGGNQDNQVSYKLYSTARLLGIRRSINR